MRLGNQIPQPPLDTSSTRGHLRVRENIPAFPLFSQMLLSLCGIQIIICYCFYLVINLLGFLQFIIILLHFKMTLLCSIIHNSQDTEAT